MSPLRTLVRREIDRSVGGHRFVQDQDFSLQTGLEWFRLCSNIPVGTDFASRQGDRIYLKSIKLTYTFQHVMDPLPTGSTRINSPIVVRMLLLERRDEADDPADRLFKRYKPGENQQNYYNFGDLNSDTIKCYQPINPDKWKVHHQKYIRLQYAPTSNTMFVQSKSGYFYFDIAKTIKYENTTQGARQCFPNFILAWYPCNMDPVFVNGNTDDFRVPQVKSQLELTHFFDP